MKMKEIKSRLFNITTLKIVGILLILFSAVALLQYGNVNSNQAVPAMLVQVYFDGEYRVADGPWQKIVKGEHIPSTKGDVTLRGNFHMLAPNGEYIGIYNDNTPIAVYTDHINITFYEGENEPYILDMENPVFGGSACGEGWSAYVLANENEDTIEILIHNPHNFGNETAIDEFLNGITLWAGLDFEKGVLASGQVQRNVGLSFIIVSLLFLGTALFSTLIHIKNSKVIWALGIVIFFAGVYLSYSAAGVSFWSESVVSNTTILGSSMMLYMLFLSIALVLLLDRTKTIGLITVAVLGVINALLFVLPIVTDVLFYDTWPWWAAAQILANIVLLACLVREFFATKGKWRWVYIFSILPLVSFVVDVVMIGLGVWNTGLSSEYVFVGFLVAAIITALRIIPNNINALTKAKELEAEKMALSAQLAESRIAVMISQIQPHFIYNTLGTIQYFCKEDPEQAATLVHNFSVYLRGNFSELDNTMPILFHKEMEHVRCYTEIEQIRFPDMTVHYDIQTEEFQLPALSVQPLVENAIKHGLMGLEEGGTVTVSTYETETHYCVKVEDNGVGFDESYLQDGKKHIGIRNVRERLQAMCGGSLTVESQKGKGTVALIQIPKEGKEV